MEIGSCQEGAGEQDVGVDRFQRAKWGAGGDAPDSSISHAGGMGGNSARAFACFSQA